MSKPDNLEELFHELHTGRHGHFAAALADAWFLADSTNRNTIEMAFPNLVWKAQQFVNSERKEVV